MEPEIAYTVVVDHFAKDVLHRKLAAKILKTPARLRIFLNACALRLEICRDRRDRWSCKIFPSCVNFSRKQRGSLSNLHRNMKFTQLFGNFIHISFKTIEIIHIHFNFNKRDHQCSHKRCFIVAKKVALYALLVCKIFGPKIRSCKIFDKFQVWVTHINFKLKIATKYFITWFATSTEIWELKSNFIYQSIASS